MTRAVGHNWNFFSLSLRVLFACSFRGASWLCFRFYFCTTHLSPLFVIQLISLCLLGSVSAYCGAFKQGALRYLFGRCHACFSMGVGQWLDERFR